MEFVDISKWVIPQQVLSFNFRTLLLFSLYTAEICPGLCTRKDLF